MYSMMMAMLLAVAQGAAAQGDAAFEAAAASCGADADRLRGIAGFFELSPEQAIAEYQPDFVVTGCLADAVRGRGRFVAIVEGGDRIVQVSRRLVVQKRLKRDPGRYSGVPLVMLKPGKAAPPEHSGRLDRVLISGSAGDLLADPKRGGALLRGLGEMTRAGGLLGIVDVPDKGGVDSAKLSALARAAGWEPAGQTSDAAAGLLLLKFRKA